MGPRDPFHLGTESSSFEGEGNGPLPRTREREMTNLMNGTGIEVGEDGLVTRWPTALTREEAQARYDAALNEALRFLDSAITEGTKALFVALVKDAGNWSGMPLFGGNVGGSPASKGHLTHLKKFDLLYTEEDYDEMLSWVIFTDLGLAYASFLGMEI